VSIGIDHLNDAALAAPQKEECLMKRSLLFALGAMALVLAVPSAALAHNGREAGRHHGRHHHRFHAHHDRFRVVHVGGGAAGAPPAGTPPGTPQNAGTVASYASNVLTLTLADGSTLSGKITSFTRIRCISATPIPVPVTGEEPGEDQGDDRGEPGFDGSKGSWRGKGHDGESEDPHASEPPCDSSALVSGAIVRAAELRVGPSGSEFESVWLLR
jgi:hypothetical protein